MTSSGVSAGVQQLAATFKEIETDVQGCSADKSADIQRLEDIKNKIESYSGWEYATHVGSDILWNGRSIYANVSAAISDYEGQKWEDFGKAIGVILAEAFIGDTKLQNLSAPLNSCMGWNGIGACPYAPQNLIILPALLNLEAVINHNG